MDKSAQPCYCCYFSKNACKCTLYCLEKLEIDSIFFRACSNYSASEKHKTRIIGFDCSSIDFEVYYYGIMYVVTYKVGVEFTIISSKILDKKEADIVQSGSLKNPLFLTFANFLLIKVNPQLASNRDLWNLITSDCDINRFFGFEIKMHACHCCGNMNMEDGRIKPNCYCYYSSTKHSFLWPNCMLAILFPEKIEEGEMSLQWGIVKFEFEESEIRINDGSLNCWSRLFFYHLQNLLSQDGEKPQK